jgi:hypothetical protein
LENYIPIGEDNDRTPLLGVFDDVEGIGEQTIGKGIVDQKARDGQEIWIMRIFTSVALERAQVVGIAEFSAKLLEEDPVFLSAIRANFAFEMTLEIDNDPIVVEQRIVDIKQENDFARGWILVRLRRHSGCMVPLLPTKFNVPFLGGIAALWSAVAERSVDTALDEPRDVKVATRN